MLAIVASLEFTASDALLETAPEQAQPCSHNLLDMKSSAIAMRAHNCRSCITLAVAVPKSRSLPMTTIACRADSILTSCNTIDTGEMADL